VLKIGELPDLRVISVDHLRFHEDPDQGRLLKLVNRLGSEGILKNPPIVARLDDHNEYVILDGANRVTALQMLGFKHLVVQAVELADPLLELHCWNHAVDKLDRTFFLTNLAEIDGVDVSKQGVSLDIEQQRPSSLRERGLLCQLTFRDGQTVGVTATGTIARQVEILCEITSPYLGTRLYDRVSYVNFDQLMKHYPQFETLVVFRRFSKDEFGELVGSGRKLPAGVTRVFLPKRALGLNIPLELLRSDLSLEQKELWLEEMIASKVHDKSIRFYREPTFVFDE
jgi:hypothetical protein